MMLEGARQLWVLYRLDAGRVDRIRIASEDCTLDAGGLTVQWLSNVSPAESVAVLASFLSATDSRRLADGALTALAMHREPAALERLLVTARDGATTHLRAQALFWLSQRAGEKAIGAISDAIANDPETEVKRRAVFALSQLPKDEGVPRLIEVARTNSNPAVRKQAMFWLGQTRDPRAVKFFEEILFK
jgi:HEAT repeat protein